MIVPRSNGLPTLAPPILGSRAARRPGESVEVCLPVRPLAGRASSSEIVVVFRADGARCEPERVNLGVIPASQTAVAVTQATILPINGHAEARIWAQVVAGEHEWESEPVLVPIAARAAITVGALTDDDRTTVMVLNGGDRRTTVHLEIGAHDEPRCDTLAITSMQANAFASEPFALDPGESAVHIVVSRDISLVTAISADGERAAATPRRALSSRTARIMPRLEMQPPHDGVRRGDIVPVRLALRNAGAAAASRIDVRYRRTPALEMLRDGLTIDGVRVIDADYLETDALATVRIPNLAPDAETVLDLSLRVDLVDVRDVDVLGVAFTVATAGVEYHIDGELLVDRRPAFSQTQTYLEAIEEDAEGVDRWFVRGVVTNAESTALEQLRVRIDTAEIAPDTAILIEETGQWVGLRPIALAGGASLYADLGTLAAGERRSFRFGFTPERTDGHSRTLRVAAALMINDDVIPLNAQERTIPGRVDLSASSLRASSANDLRIAIPVDASLEIRNDGFAAAYDVRLALEMPAGLGSTLPPAASGRWRPITGMLPPGGAIRTAVRFFLTEPPSGEDVVVTAMLDARNAEPVTIGELRFSTPTAALVDAAHIRATALADGRLAFNARVANKGDGTAEDIVVRVVDVDGIVARSTTFDGIPVDDHGAVSALVAGFRTGPLGPGEYRDIGFVVAPKDSEPFRLAVGVTAAGCAEIVSRSVPARANIQPSLAPGFPEPRRLTGEATLDRIARRPTVRVVEEPSRDRQSNDDAPKLGSNETARSTAALAPGYLPETIGGATHAASAALAASDAPRALTVGIAPTAAVPEQRVPQEVPPERPASIAEPTPISLASAAPNGAVVDELPPVAPRPVAAVVAAEPHPAFPSGEVVAPAPSLADPVHATSSDSPVAPAFAADAHAPADAPEPVRAPEAEAPRDQTPADELGTHIALVEDNMPQTFSTPRAIMGHELAFVSSLPKQDMAGWWPHVIATRLLMLKVVHASPTAAQTYAEFRSLLVESARSVVPRLLAPDFTPDEAFVAALRRNDDRARELMPELLREFDRIPAHDADRYTQLDAFVPNFLPDEVVDDAELSSAVKAYKERTIRLFGFDARLRSSDDANRDVYSAQPNATLDGALEQVASAITALMSRR
jgi:hypothetical protein